MPLGTQRRKRLLGAVPPIPMITEIHSVAAHSSNAFEDAIKSNFITKEVQCL